MSDDLPFLHLNADRTAVLLRCCAKASITEVPIGAPYRDRWQLITAEPLTVVPSVIVQPCGCHGRIRDGIWDPVRATT